MVIGLIRPHLEKVKPPRSVFVPFELGRPLGEPNDPAFQRSVLLQALSLLERGDGPVILEDFPDDAPGARDRPEWRPPVITAGGGDHARDSAAWALDLASEMAQLRPIWEQARRRFGRTSVGVSGQPPEDWPGFAAAFMTGALPHTAAHASPPLALRFLADDLKAYYGEAAKAAGPAPASRQINQWFWRHTVAGSFLIALRAACIGSENGALKTVASRFIVPGPYVPD